MTRKEFENNVLHIAQGSALEFLNRWDDNPPMPAMGIFIFSLMQLAMIEFFKEMNELVDQPVDVCTGDRVSVLCARFGITEDERQHIIDTMVEGGLSPFKEITRH